MEEQDRAPVQVIAWIAALVIGVLLVVEVHNQWQRIDGWDSKASPAANSETPESERPDAPQAEPIKGVSPKVMHGWVPDPANTKRFLRSLPKSSLSEAGPGLKVRDGEAVLLYRALYKAYEAFHPGKKWVVCRQGIGDCVSHGWAHACDIHLAVMYSLGDSSEWRAAATEAIYGGSRVEARGRSNGGYSDGSSGGAAAKWVSDWGVLFREVYETKHGVIDLRSYDATRAKEWGNYGCGGQGDNGELDEVAKKHPVRHVALVRNWSEAVSAIQSGYPVAVCSGQGFSSKRDDKGFARASGSWSHCMCFVGVRFSPDGLLCLNSWGPDWISGPKYPEDQPDGSFWVERRIVDSMLSGGDSFAVSGYEGFPFRTLKNDDWVSLPERRGTSYAYCVGGLANAL